jgi:hypothetical protein
MWVQHFRGLTRASSPIAQRKKSRLWWSRRIWDTGLIGRSGGHATQTSNRLFEDVNHAVDLRFIVTLAK